MGPISRHGAPSDEYAETSSARDRDGPDATRELPITAIILTQDEEEHVADCIRSVADFVSDVVVVDSGSTDRTVEIAERLADRVLEHEFTSYSDQRNWAQRHAGAGNEWVFHLDAGERCSEQLQREIEELFTGGPPAHDGYIVRRRTVFMGRWIRFGGIYPSFHLRLYRRELGRCEDRAYDQHFVVDGDVEELEGDLIDRVGENVIDWSRKHLRWAQVEADLRERGGEGEVEPRLFGTGIERRRWLRERVFYRMPGFLRPALYFLVRYVVLLGFLDGKPGLVYHTLHGFWYHFLVDSVIAERRLEADDPRGSS